MKKEKLKLTNLHHLETSKEEMNLLKGGEGPEEGIAWCAAWCDCTCACIFELGDRQQTFSLVTNSEINSSTMNKVIGVVTFGISHLLEH